MPAKANSGRFSSRANQTTSFFFVSGFGSGAYSAKLLAGTKQRFSGLSQPRQCGDDVLLMFVIGAVLLKSQPTSFQTASLGLNERASGPEIPLGALVRFAPDARIADIMALLDNYQASIVDAHGGMFRLQFGTRAMSREDVAALMNKLKGEKIVNLAVATP